MQNIPRIPSPRSSSNLSDGREARTARSLIGHLAIIDVDNIVLAGHSNYTIDDAYRRLMEVAHQLGTPDLSLAVMSPRMARRLGAWPWFAIPQWTWRSADQGPDAADRQLIQFAEHLVGHRPIELMSVASGDHAFAELAAIARDRQVVVPSDHMGVSRLLRRRMKPVPATNAA